jgi:uncharacterized protein
VQLSEHNILSRIEGTEQYVIVNLLSGQADVLESTEAAPLLAGQVPTGSEWVDKGYVVEPAKEQARFRSAYLDFIAERDSDEVQLFYVGSYGCNFSCSYCYQVAYEPPAQHEADAALAAFFSYIESTFVGRRKYVTLFGGEPLLPGPAARRLVEGIVEGTTQRGLDLAIVTNGFHLSEYVPMLARAQIREVQVTIDGPRQVHDSRRHLVSGAPTFDAVVAGVDAALAAGLAINLRTVLDRDNVDQFVALAHFASERGWTKQPRFKTQIGRNYELHTCQSARHKLYTRLELFQDLYRESRKHPELLEFHKPAFSVARFLSETGKLPGPLFDACPATKTEWAFDYTGKIYSCTATVGKEGESLGTFWPKVSLDACAVQQWEERDVLAIDDCRSCSQRLACGGGCGSVAKNRTGSTLSADCRPVRELIGLGTSLYST